MREKPPRPHGSVTSQRAAGSEFLGRSSNPQNSQPSRSGQDILSVAAPDSLGPIAWTHIFVSRLGRVGYWIACCPICGYEHTHGGYAPFDPREKQGYAKVQVNLRGPQSLGWRVPHCHQAPWEAVGHGGHEYELMLAAGPARFAPGANRARAARRTLAYLRSLGIETSDATIPSTRPLSWWRWR
jgi:hypothetical protein